MALGKELGNCTQQHDAVVDFWNLLPFRMNLPITKRIQTIVVANKPVRELLIVNTKGKKKGYINFFSVLITLFAPLFLKYWIWIPSPLLIILTLWLYEKKDINSVITRDQDVRAEVVAFVARTTTKFSILCTICTNKAIQPVIVFKLLDILNGNRRKET